MTAYQLAQIGMTSLKSAVYRLLEEKSGKGIRNVDIGRALGIFAGRIKHEGHISRTLLACMEAEGVVSQNGDKRWFLLDHNTDARDEE